MPFKTLLISLIFAFYAARHTSPEDQKAQEARLTQVAEDIWYVSEAHPVFSGERGPEATALALYAIGAHESGFREDVQDCSLCSQGRWCDRGRSVSLYQLRQGASWQLFDREHICTDHRVSVRLARDVFARYSRLSSIPMMFSGYATGGRGLRPCNAALSTYKIFSIALAQAGIKFRHSNEGFEAVQKTSKK